MRLRPEGKARRFAAGVVFVAAIFIGRVEVSAQPAPGGSPRIALVIGESHYKTGPLASAANDAGLIADTLQRAGFDVAGAADLDQDGLRKALREFVDKAAAAGPDAVAFVYISGRGLQYAGENYIAPVEAAIPRAANAPLEAVRLSDYLQPLAQLPLRARVVVLDAARINNFAQTGEPLAGGLALVDPPAGSLYAYNAAPGSVAPDDSGPYGVYAQALAEALRQPGLPIDEAFAQTRLRVSQATKGAVIPWDESKLTGAPALIAAAPDAPPPVAAAAMTRLQARPIREYPMEDAFAATLERDTIQGYLDFLAAYPDSPYAPRVRAMLALRREAITWRRAYLANSPNSYWSYLRAYPHGPHAEDARRRLAFLSAPLAPPPTFDVVEFDVPPPPPAEMVYFRRPYVVFDDPDWGPPPPPMGYLPPPVMIVDEPPPPPPHMGLLPLPLVVAPLVGAAVASQMGVFHAPAVVQTQVPAAQDYYNNFNRRAQVAPGAAPGVAPGTAAPRGAPGTAPSGAPGVAPGAVPGAPPSGAPASVVPAPGAPVVPAAPGGAPALRPGAPAAPTGAVPGAPATPGGAPLPHSAAPGATPAAPAAPTGAPLPHPAPAGAPTGAAPAAPTAPGGSPLPHPLPSAAPGGPASTAPAAPTGAPLPHSAPAGAPTGAAPTAPTAPGGAPLPRPLPSTAPGGPASTAPAAPTGAPLPHPAPAGAPTGAAPAAPTAPGGAPLPRPLPSA
ncbi:caspase family protein, partial [Rhodoblastus sp.]|uniref:caspase family protein n=1 Tax=Rhodoblastus sp. TaxID=1962975 RepID=UPI0035B37C3B